LPKEDKLKHFFVGFVIYYILTIFLSVEISALFLFGISIIWELYQRYIEKGDNDLEEMSWDAFYTFLPGLVQLIYHIINVPLL